MSGDTSGSAAVRTYDVVVVGAGVAGIAAARAVALLADPRLKSGGRRRPRVAVLEAGPGPITGASRGNSAFIHSGFDCTPGTLESRFVRRGHALFEAWVDSRRARGFDAVPYSKCGAIMLARDAAELAAIKDTIQPNATANGVETRLLASAAQVAALEPAVVGDASGTTNGASMVVGGLLVASEWCVDPFMVPAMYLGEAMATDRVDFFARHEVSSVTRSNFTQEGDSAVRYLVECSTGGGSRSAKARFSARIVVNCAGLHGDAVDRLRPWLSAEQQSSGAHNGPRFVLFPRLGRFVAFGPKAREASGLRYHALLPLPTKKTKGVIAFLTHDRETLVIGPTAEDPGEVEPSHAAVTARLIQAAADRLPGLRRYIESEVSPATATAAGSATSSQSVAGGPNVVAFTYAGKRPALRGRTDYFIDRDDEHAWITVAGIRSTGLTASLALGEYVATAVRDILVGQKEASTAQPPAFDDPPLVTPDDALRMFPRVTHPLSAAARRESKL